MREHHEIDMGSDRGMTRKHLDTPNVEVASPCIPKSSNLGIPNVQPKSLCYKGLESEFVRHRRPTTDAAIAARWI
jgi:hypothetical protein